MAIQPIGKDDHFWTEYREMWRVPLWPWFAAPFGIVAILVILAIIVL